MSLKSDFRSCVAEGTHRRTERAKNMTEAVSLWIQREYWWYLLSFKLKPLWYSLSVSCNTSLYLVLKSVNLFYRLNMLQPSFFIMEANSWHILADDGKETNSLPFFVFVLPCHKNGWAIQFPSLMRSQFSNISLPVLEHWYSGIWKNFCTEEQKLCSFWYFSMAFLLWDLCKYFPARMPHWVCKSKAPRVGRGFAHLTIWRHLKSSLGVEDPLVLTRLMPLAVAPPRLVTATIPWAGEAGGTMLPVLVAGVGRGRWGEKCNSSLNFS